MLRRLALAMVLAAGLAACTGGSGGAVGSAASPASSPAPSVAGGPPRVTGTVTAGPVCPVEKSPPDPKCAPRPVAGAVIVATDPSGQEVGRATTAADGTYSLAVSEGRGTFTITGQPVKGLMGVPKPAQVTLGGPSDVQRVDLSYDTGIR
jgi:hypothetical protein